MPQNWLRAGDRQLAPEGALKEAHLVLNPAFDDRCRYQRNTDEQQRGGHTQIDTEADHARVAEAPLLPLVSSWSGRTLRSPKKSEKPLGDAL